MFWPWEAAALLTGGPTVTDLSRYVRRHRAGQLAIVAWTLGLLYHLLVSKSPQ
jgi:purine-cytosine permease-like protein